MRRIPLPAAKSSGFTLIEMMVAVFIMIVIAGAAYGAFRAANASTVRVEERIEINQTGRILLDRIGAELQSACLPDTEAGEGVLGEDTDEAGLWQRDRLTFTTAVGRTVATPGASGGLKRVAYYVEADEEGNPLGLFIQENRLPGLRLSEEEIEGICLSEAVRSFDCRYYDSSAGEWLDEWSDDARMPAAVRVKLELAPPGEGAEVITLVSTFNLMLAVSGGKPPEGGAP